MNKTTDKAMNVIEKSLEKRVEKNPTAKKLFHFLKESFALDPKVADKEPPDGFVNKLSLVASVLEGFFLGSMQSVKQRKQKSFLPDAALARVSYLVAAMLLNDEEPELSRAAMMSLHFVDFDDMSKVNGDATSQSSD